MFSPQNADTTKENCKNKPNQTKTKQLFQDSGNQPKAFNKLRCIYSSKTSRKNSECLYHFCLSCSLPQCPPALLSWQIYKGMQAVKSSCFVVGGGSLGLEQSTEQFRAYGNCPKQKQPLKQTNREVQLQSCPEIVVLVRASNKMANQLKKTTRRLENETTQSQSHSNEIDKFSQVSGNLEAHTGSTHTGETRKGMTNSLIPG